MNNSINFGIIKSGELHTFGQRALALYEGKELNGTGMDVLLPRVNAAFNNFNLAFERNTKDPYTLRIAQLDAIRDESFLGFRKYIEACSHSSKAGWNLISRYKYIIPINNLNNST